MVTLNSRHREMAHRGDPGNTQYKDRLPRLCLSHKLAMTRQEEPRFAMTGVVKHNS